MLANVNFQDDDDIARVKMVLEREELKIDELIWMRSRKIKDFAFSIMFFCSSSINDC